MKCVNLERGEIGRLLEMNAVEFRKIESRHARAEESERRRNHVPFHIVHAARCELLQRRRARLDVRVRDVAQRVMRRVDRLEFDRLSDQIVGATVDRYAVVAAYRERAVVQRERRRQHPRAIARLMIETLLQICEDLVRPLAGRAHRFLRDE